MTSEGSGIDKDRHLPSHAAICYRRFGTAMRRTDRWSAMTTPHTPHLPAGDPRRGLRSPSLPSPVSQAPMKGTDSRPRGDRGSRRLLIRQLIPPGRTFGHRSHHFAPISFRHGEEAFHVRESEGVL